MVEIPTFPQVVFNNLILYNNLSILYVLSREFKFSSESRKSTTEEVNQDVNESFCIIRSSFLMYIYMYYIYRKTTLITLDKIIDKFYIQTLLQNIRYSV